jgi:DNA uptake protein ComE-like DNA-binding protein
MPAKIAALAVFLVALPGTFHSQAAYSRTMKAAKATIRPSELVDVNHASLEDLMTLPGIQDAYAAKIVKNRPYANKTQLSTKGVLPAATYRRIRALIIAKQ